MDTPKVVINTIAINAPSSAVWDALVNPQKTKIYMFGCETVSDWQIGSDLLWKGQHEGQEMVFVKGKILEINPGTYLKYTVIDPFATYADVPENYLNVTYEVIPQGPKTMLIVTQDGFETAADGEKRYLDVYNNGEGWNTILAEIKKVAEQN
ncbi:MAG: SRPBCC domain-containing protein [Janthinobacterium lividum]